MGAFRAGAAFLTGVFFRAGVALRAGTILRAAFFLDTFAAFAAPEARRTAFLRPLLMAALARPPLDAFFLLPALSDVEGPALREVEGPAFRVDGVGFRPLLLTLVFFAMTASADRNVPFDRWALTVVSSSAYRKSSEANLQPAGAEIPAEHDRGGPVTHGN
jgi:hypothetical protein